MGWNLIPSETCRPEKADVAGGLSPTKEENA